MSHFDFMKQFPEGFAMALAQDPEATLTPFEGKQRKLPLGG